MVISRPQMVAQEGNPSKTDEHYILRVSPKPCCNGLIFFHCYEGTPICLHHPLLTCFWRTQTIYFKCPSVSDDTKLSRSMFSGSIYFLGSRSKYSFPPRCMPCLLILLICFKGITLEPFFKKSILSMSPRFFCMVIWSICVFRVQAGGHEKSSPHKSLRR